MPCTVLVVDDEKYLVDFIADVLEDEGFSVVRGYDGLQAMKAVERRPPDLVIADIMMPYLDGLALAQRLQKREPPIPIILMSAARRELPDFDGPFLPKPFELEELVAIARDLTAMPAGVASKRVSRPRQTVQTRRVATGN